MKINFNKNILNTIHAVKDYRKFLTSYHVMLLENEQFDKDTETEKFFYSLPITDGLKKSKVCYEAIINYPQSMLSELNKIEYKDLHNYEFGY